MALALAPQNKDKEDQTKLIMFPSCSLASCLVACCCYGLVLVFAIAIAIVFDWNLPLLHTTLET
jgi:hypothetical protein